MNGILGQDTAMAQLHRALQTGRMHHAFVFHGREGVGKCTTARALARVLLCPHPTRDTDGTVEACGQCHSCELATGDGHPDLHMVTKEMARYSRDADIRQRKLIEFPVRVIAEQLVEAATRSPVMQKGKVFIVDEADLLNEEGQNMLLKTLEEPPSGMHIILVTHREEKLLPTIRSRCQRVAFAPLRDDIVASWLDRRDESPDGRIRPWLIAFADGSLGRLELALAYDLHAWSRTVSDGIREMAGGTYPIPLGKAIADHVDDFAKRWVEAHDNASKEAANQRAAALMWILIGQFARTQLRRAAADLGSSDPETSEMTLSPWLGVINAVWEGERELRRNVNLKLVMDHAVSKMYRALST